MNNKWPIGFRFFYKSKYNDSILQGIVEQFIEGDGLYVVDSNINLNSGSIKSTKGVWYKMSEVEIETIAGIRSDKLNNLGL
jgi:hypothetical protein